METERKRRAKAFFLHAAMQILTSGEALVPAASTQSQSWEIKYSVTDCRAWNCMLPQKYRYFLPIVCLNRKTQDTRNISNNLSKWVSNPGGPLPNYTVNRFWGKIYHWIKKKKVSGAIKASFKKQISTYTWPKHDKPPASPGKREPLQPRVLGTGDAGAGTWWCLSIELPARAGPLAASRSAASISPAAAGEGRPRLWGTNPLDRQDSPAPEALALLYTWTYCK